MKALCLEARAGMQEGAGWNRALSRQRVAVDGGRICGDAEDLAGPLVNQMLINAVEMNTLAWRSVQAHWHLRALRMPVTGSPDSGLPCDTS